MSAERSPTESFTPGFAILAVSGSLRRTSSNGAILSAAARVAPSDMAVEIYDGLATLPHFNPDLDRALDDPALPAEVRALRAAVGRADALLISSPEYAHGVPGSLKNALDWLVGGSEMVEMPVALWNTAPHATFAHQSLLETLRTMSARIVQEAIVSISLRGRDLDPASLAADREVAETLSGALLALRKVGARRR
jgi:NAD(P)H-dependent FMN reductase